MSAFFGRPRVQRAKLLAAGLSEAELAAFGAQRGVSSLVPCSGVWPMGFSWSSCVAQETLLSIVEWSGLDSTVVLASDAPLPEDLTVAFAVATDDLMVFSDAGPGGTTQAVCDFEASLSACGALKNAEKDVDDALSATCVGIDLVVSLSHARTASPGAVAAYLGVAQWYDLLRRLQLSVFHHVYDFASGAKATDWTRRAVPDPVVHELLLDMTLSAFGAVDMRLPFLPLLGATDASTGFGHGAAVATLPIEEIRRVARLAWKGGAYVCLDAGPELPEALDARLGPRHLLGL